MPNSFVSFGGPTPDFISFLFPFLLDFFFHSFPKTLLFVNLRCEQSTQDHGFFFFTTIISSIVTVMVRSSLSCLVSLDYVESLSSMVSLLVFPKGHVVLTIQTLRSFYVTHGGFVPGWRPLASPCIIARRGYAGPLPLLLERVLHVKGYLCGRMAFSDTTPPRARGKVLIAYFLPLLGSQPPLSSPMDLGMSVGIKYGLRTS